MDYEKAIADYTKYIKLDSTDSYDYNEYNNRGISYHAIKNDEKACQDWKKASELGSPDAIENLAKYCK